MGWFVESYRGVTRVHHGGNIDGFSAMVSIVPGAGVGAVALTNMNGSALPVIVARQATDRLLGLPAIDWGARLLARRDAARKADKSGKAKAAEERCTGTRPAHALEEYLGEYEHPAYGTVSITSAPAAGPAAPAKPARGPGAAPPPALQAGFHGIPMALEHWHFETWKATPSDPALAEQTLFLQFHDSVAGDVVRLTINLEPNASEIAFARKPPARLSDPAFLRGLTGVYVIVDNPNVTMTVDLKGNGLTAFVPGQPIYELVPHRGTEFRLKQLTGYGVRFVLDATGAVSEALMIQPNAVHRMRRK
jgi:hypothetical protein